MKGFIELTERYYNSNSNEYITGSKYSVNVNHIFKIGDRWIKTIEDVKEAPSLCVESYDEIILLIKQSTEPKLRDNIQDYV